MLKVLFEGGWEGADRSWKLAIKCHTIPFTLKVV